MVGEPDYLNGFLARIDPYLSHWSSLGFACIAARIGSEWVQVVGKAILSTGPCDPEPNFERMVDLDDFRAYVAHLEAKAIHRLVSNLKESQVISGFVDDSVRLVPTGSHPYFWQQPSIQRRMPGGNVQKGWTSAWSMHGNGSNSGSFPPQSLWQDIDTRLLRHDPPYNGFVDLCGKLGLSFDPYSSTSAYFNLAAELPARFLSCDVNRNKKCLALTMKYVGTPELVVGWLPGRDTRREAVSKGNPQTPAEYELALPIPPGATEVKANLLIMGWVADAISLRIGWENILLRICEFFDPDQAKLTSFLFDENNLKNVNPFEHGVARLLGLAGYTVLWFGKGAKAALPDLVAYVRLPLGAERIIYGECTLKNPAEKLSDLAKRADDLRGFLGLEAGTILPVVFVRNDATDQDHQAASELGLVLCDGNGIHQLQDKIKTDASPDEVFQFLRSMGSITLIP